MGTYLEKTCVGIQQYNKNVCGPRKRVFLMLMKQKRVNRAEN